MNARVATAELPAASVPSTLKMCAPPASGLEGVSLLPGPEQAPKLGVPVSIEHWKVIGPTASVALKVKVGVVAVVVPLGPLSTLTTGVDRALEGHGTDPIGGAGSSPPRWSRRPAVTHVGWVVRDVGGRARRPEASWYWPSHCPDRGGPGGRERGRTAGHRDPEVGAPRVPVEAPVDPQLGIRIRTYQWVRDRLFPGIPEWSLAGESGRPSCTASIRVRSDHQWDASSSTGRPDW